MEYRKPKLKEISESDLDLSGSGTVIASVNAVLNVIVEIQSMVSPVILMVIDNGVVVAQPTPTVTTTNIAIASITNNTTTDSKK